MQRRLGRRDYLLLTVVCVAFVVLAIQIPFANRGFDHPQKGLHWRLLEAPGRVLGWGGVAVLIIAIPYALVAWLKGRAPGRAISAVGTLVFGVGVGGLAGVLASAPIHGGGIAGGALAHMLADSLGSGFAAVVLAAIAIPGLFLSLAPLLLETGYTAKTTPDAGTASRGTSRTETSRTQGGTGGGAGPAVLVKPWYPERRIGPDGEELPMTLGGTDVGPIRYRDPPPAETSATAVAAPPPDTSHTPPPAPATSPPPSTPPSISKMPIPKATPPPPAFSPTRRPPVISGVRYVDEAPAPAVPLTREHAVRDADDRSLPAGVRFAPTVTPAAAPTPPPVIVSPPPIPSAGPRLPRADGDAVGVAPDPADLRVAVREDVRESAAPPSARPRHDDVDVVSAWVAANPLPKSEPVEPTPPAVSPEMAAQTPPDDEEPVAVTAEPSAHTSLHPSVVGHRKKLSDSGIFEGASPAADRPGRPPKPRPRPAAVKDWREALHGLFSSLPVEELPPIRVPDELVGRSAEEEAALRADAPGQMKLFDASDTSSSGRASGANDALFDASVDAALERGTASLVLLKRKLGVGYARAASLMDALVAQGVLGEMTASGSRPTLLTQAEWNRRKKR